MSTAAILAGGRALRFGGRPKPLLPLGGRRIVDRLLEALRAVTDQVFIVANDGKAYAGLGVPVHSDVLAAAGPLGGVHTALSVSRSSRTLVVAGDMPFPNPPLLARLLRRAHPGVDVAVPRTRDGWQPLCACYRAPCLPVLERRIAAGTLKAGDALREMRRHELGAGELAPLDPHGTLFFNVNTPADYARALALAAYHDASADRPRPDVPPSARVRERENNR